MNAKGLQDFFPKIVKNAIEFETGEVTETPWPPGGL